MAGTQRAEPLHSFKLPRASSELRIVVKSSLFLQHHKLLLITHYNLLGPLLYVWSELAESLDATLLYSTLYSLGLYQPVVSN